MSCPVLPRQQVLHEDYCDAHAGAGRQTQLPAPVSVTKVPTSIQVSKVPETKETSSLIATANVGPPLLLTKHASP